MEKRLISKEKLVDVLKKIAGDLTVFAPVREEDNVLFKVLEKGKEPLLNYANTRNAPKKAFFPHTEKMMAYARTEKGIELYDVLAGAKEAVLFGVRPCDARSFVLLDRLFDQEKYGDPFYMERRRKTTVIAMACIHPPYGSCFCTSVDGSPVSCDGADVLLTDIGETYLAEFVTPKGENLLYRYFGEFPQPDEASETKKTELAAAAEKEIKSRLPAHEIKPILDRCFEHPFWNTIHGTCLACGTCTYLCPTCHCFDISDEVKGNNGVRLRNWDSCMFPLFTKETSGHNPRPTQKERWRQRVMHKFRYYVDNFNAIACVGCGRCVMHCPVNLDIRKVVQDISKL
jgi:sulfhydrogenase subunit beta (sulfur reductase)